MTKTTFGRTCALAALTVALVGAAAENAYATHFRYGTINWSVPDTAQPSHIQFRVTTGWRRSFDCGPSQTPPGCTPWGLNHYPNVGEVINLNYAAGLTFNFGDGSPAVNMAGATVTAISSTEDWLVAEWTVTHAYSSSGAVAFMEECCRISTLADGNDDRAFRLESRVIIGGATLNRPPATSSLPVITLGASQAVTFAIPASDPDGDPLNFKFTAASTTSVPAPGTSGLVTKNPSGMTMTSAGVISWTPAALSGPPERLHAIQVTISDNRGAFTTLDVVLRVINLPPGNPPSVTIDGSSSPVTISIVPNQLATATIDVSDIDVDPATGLADTLVTLNSGGLPGGATVAPVLPHQARVPYSVTFSWTPGLSDQGAHTIVFGATDNTGRQRSNALSIIVENQPPAGTCTAPQELEAVSSSGASATVSIDVGDPDGDPMTIEWYVDGVLVRTDMVAGGLPPTPVTLDLTQVFTLGAHAVHIGIADDHDHVTGCDTTVSVVDTTPPSFDPPAHQENEATSSSGAPAAWSAPTATDAADASVPVTCDAASGDTFPLGTTLVACSATDDSGNATAHSFTIDVVDTTPPAISGLANQTVPLTSPAGTSVSWTASAVDLVDGAVPVVCTPPSGHTFPLGQTPVSCTATDAHTNGAAGSFLVTVTDATAPAIGGVTPSMSQLWPPNHQMVPLSLDVVATDESGAPVCSIVDVTSNEPQNGLGDGDTPVDWVVTGPLSVELRAERSGRGGGRAYTIGVRCTDGSGNAAMGRATVIVPRNMGR